MEVVGLMVHLAESVDRPQAARALARALGGDELVVMVRDPEVDVLLPAPGFAPTLDGGPSWRALVQRCLAPGCHAGEVELPRGRRRHAEALACKGLALILLADRPSGDGLSALKSYLPLLSFAFGAEQKARIATAQAAEAGRVAGRAQALAQALDAARADASALNAELRAEHQRKDHFLAMLAHELRNPLSPLVSSLDLMRLAAPADPALRQCIDVMTRQTRQLSRLVDDLLDVSRVSRGRIELQCEPLPLAAVIGEALEASQAIIERRRHAVELDLATEALLVNGDRVRLTQVFSNLLHNAAKYTATGGRIRISSRSDGANAVVEVSDNGTGIDAGTLPHIFTLFNQAPVSLARSQGGLGIGLTLVRMLAELHGGKVEPRSEGLGKGSTFTVILPLLKDAIQRTPQREPARRLARPLRILIVDDNADAADVLSGLVDVLGHQADVAYSSASALQVAAESEADLVFLDIGLPDFDGYEVARRLRRMMSPQTYLVALTGYAGEQYAKRAREAGFNEHLVKPATLEAIQAITARAAGQACHARRR